MCSPETILSAPLPTLCLQRSALLLHPSACIKLTSCRSLKLMETREKLHFTLHLHDQHHAQMKFQLLPPSPDDRSVREHRGLEGRSQVPQEPLGLGAGGCTNTHQQMLQVSLREPGGELNMMQIVWSNSFALICTISFCCITVLHPALCRGGKKPPNAALRPQAKCLLEATNKHVRVCQHVRVTPQLFSPPPYTAQGIC